MNKKLGLPLICLGLLFVLLMSGCSKEISSHIFKSQVHTTMAGDRFITNAMWFVYSEHTSLINVSALFNTTLDANCLPIGIPQLSLADFNFSSNKSYEVCVVFDDIERPQCFRGWFNSCEKFTPKQVNAVYANLTRLRGEREFQPIN